MSKSKKKKFSKVQAVKEKSRAVLGQPQATRVRSGRKAGASRVSLDAALNQKNLAPNPHYIPRESFVDGAPRLSTTDQLHIKQAIVFRKPREGPRPKGTVLQYSPEVIQHLNILRQSQGEEAANKYLEQLKKEQTSMHSEIAERLTREHLAPTPVDGSLTTALKDAELKIAFFEAEIKRCTAEAERWRQITASLKNVIKLTTGEVAAPKPQAGEKRERGYWDAKVRSVLSRKSEPMRRTDLQNLLVEEEDCEKQVVYAAVHQLLKKEALCDIDGKIALPEWTDPEAKKKNA